MQLWQQDPTSGVYNVPWAVRLYGKLDTAALQTALRLVVERHLVSCSNGKASVALCQPTCTMLAHEQIVYYVIWLQALRTKFVRHEAGGLQQAVLSANAVQLQMAVADISSMPVPQDAAGFLAACDPSSTEWHTFASAPFDLFNDVLIRCKV